MGLFDGILSGVTAAAPLVSGLLGFSGQQDTNEQQIHLAQNQMDFQERMSGTAYQRAVADMKAAGLNPMLAYSQGGASSPGGAMAQIGNPAIAASNAAASAAQIEQTRAMTSKTVAEKDNVEADTALKGGQLRQTLSSAGHLDASASQIRQDMQTFDDRWQKLKYEVKAAGWGSKSAEFQAGILNSQDFMEAYKKDQLQPQLKAQLDKLLAEGDQIRANARLLGLKVPEAVREADFFSSPEGRSAMFFRNAPRSVVSAAAGAAGAASADVMDNFRGFR